MTTATFSFAECLMQPSSANAATAPPAGAWACLPRIVLASRSARRRLLLEAAGIGHEAVAPDFDDAGLQAGSVSPEQWVSSLAYLKAWTLARTVAAPAVVIGADTACVLDEALIGTPVDGADAESILRRFVGRSHDVVTGVAIIETDTGRRHLFAERATVRFGELSNDDLRGYLASENWRGKAGAYNLAERLEAGWPITYDGDATAIMGLPMGALSAALSRIARLRQKAP